MTSQNVHFEKGLCDSVDVCLKKLLKQILNSICQKLEVRDAGTLQPQISQLSEVS